jgi:predicted transcriptional regulator
MVLEEKIVLKTMNRPSKESVDKLSEWFCQVLGLGSKDNELEPEILKAVISGSVVGNGITSKDLNTELEIPRSTVIYHLNRFICSGIVVRKGRKYYLRSEDMKGTIEELQADMEREFVRMMEFADKMDKLLEDDFHGRKRSKR